VKDKEGDPISGATVSIKRENLTINLGERLLRYVMGAVTGNGMVTALLPNFPNPFNPETWIPFKLARGSDVRIEIYDLTGRLVRRLNLGMVNIPHIRRVASFR